MSAVAKFLAQQLGKLVKRFLVKKLTNKKSRNKFLKVIVTILIIVLVLVITVFTFLFGGVATFAENLSSFFRNLFPGQSEEDYLLWVNDTQKVYEKILEDEDFEFTDGDLALLDRDTLKRIFKAIVEYDERRANTLDVEYEYEEYKLVDVPAPSPAPGASPAPSPAVTKEFQYFYPTAEVTLRRGDIEASLDKDGNDMFEIRWQPIVALAAYAAQENNRNWGQYGNPYMADPDLDKVDLTNYFLSDAMINEIIEVFYFRTTYRYDAIASGKTYYDFDFFCNGTNDVAFYYSHTVNEAGEYTKVYEPASAPMTIKNSFINYTYNYVEIGENLYECDSRAYTLVPEGFVKACKKIIPDFEGETFVDILEVLPACEDLVKYYDDTIIPMAKRHQIDSYTTTDSTECPTIGVIFYSPNGINDGALGGIIWDGGDFALPIYEQQSAAFHVIPQPGLEDTGDGGKKYYLSSGALRRCDVSDGLTKEQIIKLLTEVTFITEHTTCPLLESRQTIEDTAQCLLDYQNTYGDSVLALIGIITQEGGWDTVHAVKGWNFFHIVAHEGFPGYTYVTDSGVEKTSRFAGFKAVYENSNSPYSSPVVNAFNHQITWVSDNYWRNARYGLQNNYYQMIWTGYWDGVNTSTCDLTNIVHSYCPPWEDTAMPYTSDSYYVMNGGGNSYLWRRASASNLGWPNRCAYFRSICERLLGIVHDDEDYEVGGEDSK